VLGSCRGGVTIYYNISIVVQSLLCRDSSDAGASLFSVLFHFFLSVLFRYSTFGVFPVFCR
jgi:hypothetical protein